MFRLTLFSIFIGLHFPFIHGLLNHGLPTTPDGPSLVDVWKELYALHDKVSTLQIENKELRINQTVLFQDNNALKAQGAGLQAQINALQKENMELRSNQTILQRDNQVLSNVNTGLRSLETKVNKNLEVLQKKVLFSAKMEISNRVKNNVLQYSNVITNVRGAYNAADSTFTAPLEGFYVFAWSTSQYNRHYTASSLMKNGARVFSQGVYTGEVTGQGDSTSQTGTLHLAKGDRVWIKLIVGTPPFIEKAGGTFNDVDAFTGFLL